MSASRAGARPRLLVLNLYYRPAVEATGQLLAELCEDLAADYDVTVVAGAAPGAPHGRARHGGVEVIRVASTAFSRRRAALRALNYVTYLGAATLRLVGGERPDAVLCMTDPPVVGNVALLAARGFRVPLVVVSQDVFPEVAVLLRRLDNPLVVALLGVLVRRYLRGATRVVAVGETMRARLERKGARPERVRVISNWVDTSALAGAPQDNPWSRHEGLAGRFVVMHSGNVGYAQDLDALVRAATFLRDLDVTIAIVGDGARRKELVLLARQLGVDAVRFLPYQSRDVLEQSLSAATVHVVGLARGLAGYVVPSRLLGVLAVGRPVIAAADPDSETARIVADAGCGVVVPPGRPDLLAAEIRRAHDGGYDLAAMGRRAREYAVAEADRGVAVERYRQLLREVVRQTG